MARRSKTPGSGRKEGTPNKTSAAIRARIEKDADPIGFLADIKNGELIKAAVVKEGGVGVDVLPTLDQRMTAAIFLARRVSPEAKSIIDDDDSKGPVVSGSQP